MSATPIIRLEDIRRSYAHGDMTTEVLKGISLDIMPGDFVALQGPSGSGKSTLLHILGLLDRPSSGNYVLEGENVADMDDDHRSMLRNRHFGFVFQSFYLISYASALENVLLPGLYGHESRRSLSTRAQELLELVGLADRADFRPSQLSGGQQQRVALARALLNSPRVVFADEPTGQLDSTTSAEIMTLLSRINADGTTVVMVTHDEDTARHARTRINLADGRIA
ncbi:putative ABC transport system ATP-binding protein [Desulfobaculum xiamenense]|uniref:Putative ABC transport system ATP-binding protein n=1 Tax=Desulfobaculum xiamenense TaxID=995050 RepID=A0A846QN37_9BACT|nr:ABC transporter ATP-binding protein [Desulfobaculum xiamenense]NJB67882.1 putative ABC transport system ATP-binding protein [Desulfobaculum xiamenense]